VMPIWGMFSMTARNPQGNGTVLIPPRWILRKRNKEEGILPGVGPREAITGPMGLEHRNIKN
jgi:hypothetical protein